jgi:YEATS domain-containing protein 4
VTETGWGEFEIQIRIYFVNEANEKPVVLNHHLKLHPWPHNVASGPNNMTAGPKLAPAPAPAEEQPKTEATVVDLTAPAEQPAPLLMSPVHSYQYDEIVFTDPTETFLNTLVAYPPTPLCAPLLELSALLM